MYRAALAILCGLAVSPAAIAPADLGTRLVAFHLHYNPFSRALLGCPKNAREMEDCDQRLGTVDYAEYLKTRKAAMKLFDLRE